MNKKIFMLSMLLSFFCLQSRATVVYVDSAHLGGVQNGQSWATAFSNFQSGIDAANAGDSVWVAKGTYMADTTILYAFTMKEGVKIFGGFLNTYTTISQRNTQANTTILKGSYNSVINNINNNLTNASLIDGFTIKNGISWAGGGMKNINASPIINNCIFIANKAQFPGDYPRGGAIFNGGSTAIINNCSFFSNIVISQATNMKAGGSAIYNAYSNVNIANCNFDSNSTTFYGGGAVYNTVSNVVIQDCIFTSNTGPSRGGAIYNADTSVVIVTGCTFYNNQASGGGAMANVAAHMTVINSGFTENGHYLQNGAGGAAIYNTGSLDVDSCSFSNNQAGGQGGIILNSGFTSSNINHCNFINNGPHYLETPIIFNQLSSNPSIINNCTFASNNSDTLLGNAVLNYEAISFLSNCLFYKFKSYRGAAIQNMSNSYSRVVNCTIFKNTTYNNAPNPDAGGIYNSSNSNADVINTIIWGNTGGIFNDSSSSSNIKYCLIQGMGSSLLNHNIDGDIDPNFVDASNDDYHLTNMSICINAGRNDSIPVGITTDISGNSRIFDNIVDMGVYEYNAVNTPSVDLGNDTSICLGNNLLLNAPYYAYATYLWNTGDTSRTISVNSNDTYFVAISSLLGIASDTFILAIDSLPVVILGSDTIINPNSFIVLDAGNFGANYLWSTGATTQTITVNAAGTYSVTVTSNAGCTGTDTIIVTVNPLGINDVNAIKQSVTIHPNPAKEIVYIDISDEKLLHTQVIIADAYGRIIRNVLMENKSQQLPLSGLASGIYILKMENGAAVKIVKD